MLSLSKHEGRICNCPDRAADIFTGSFAGMTSWKRRLAVSDGALASAPLAVAQRVLHLAGELLQAEGLGEEVDVGVLVEPAAEIVLGVAGDEDDLHVGA